MNLNALLVLAIVCFLLAAIAAGSADGEVLFASGVWLALGLAGFAASHLPT